MCMSPLGARVGLRQTPTGTSEPSDGSLSAPGEEQRTAVDAKVERAAQEKAKMEAAAAKVSSAAARRAEVQQVRLRQMEAEREARRRAEEAKAEETRRLRSTPAGRVLLELRAAQTPALFGGIELPRLQAAITAASELSTASVEASDAEHGVIDMISEEIGAARRLLGSQAVAALKKARSPPMLGSVDTVRLAAVIQYARDLVAGTELPGELAGEIDSQVEAGVAVLEAEAEKVREREARRERERLDSLQKRAEEKAKAREGEVERRRQEEIQKAAQKLSKDGHLANSRGAFREARAAFVAACELHFRPADAISAANMAAKLGECDVAAAEYQTLLDRDELTPRHREVVREKLQESLEADSAVDAAAVQVGAAAAVESEAAANSFDESASIEENTRRVVAAAQEEAERLAEVRKPNVFDADFDLGEALGIGGDAKLLTSLTTCLLPPGSPEVDPLASPSRTTSSRTASPRSFGVGCEGEGFGVRSPGRRRPTSSELLPRQRATPRTEGHGDDLRKRIRAQVARDEGVSPEASPQACQPRARVLALLLLLLSLVLLLLPSVQTALQLPPMPLVVPWLRLQLPPTWLSLHVSHCMSCCAREATAVAVAVVEATTEAAMAAAARVELLRDDFATLVLRSL